MINEQRLVDWLKMRAERSKSLGSHGENENIYYDGEAYAFELVLRKIEIMGKRGTK